MKRPREIVIQVPAKSARYVALQKGTFKTVGHGRTLAAALDRAAKDGHAEAAAMWIPQPSHRYTF